MPIKPKFNQAGLPPDWNSRIRPEVMERAKNCCEFCGVKNYAVGYHKPNGEFDRWGWGETAKDAKVAVRSLKAKREFPYKFIAISLKVTRLDGDHRNNSLSNLKALCQRCHNRQMIELEDEGVANADQA